MRSGEEYLDQLLAAALQENMGVADTANQTAASVKKEITSDTQEKQAAPDETTEKMEQISDRLPENLQETETGDMQIDLDHLEWDKMQNVTLENLMDAAEAAQEEAVQEEAVREEVTPELSDDPNHMMTPDEIAALLAAQESKTEDEQLLGDQPEEPAREETVQAEVMPELSDDPNHMMTPDEIAALLAAQESKTEDEQLLGEQPEEPVWEEAVREEVMPELSDDPNHMMTPDEIAALLAAQESKTEDEQLLGDQSEETVRENEMDDIIVPETEPEDDLNRMMTPEEIAALLESQGDDMDIDEAASEEEIEEQLKNAESLGMEEAEAAEAAFEAENADLDITQMLGGLGEDDADISDIADLLKKSDHNELLDESLVSEETNAVSGEETDAIDAEETSEVQEKGKKKKQKKKKEKKENADAEDDTESEKKPGFFQKLLDVLTTVEEEEGENSLVPEQEQTKLSNENLDVLNQLDAEENKKGKKKPKKEKKVKEKKEKKKPKKEKVKKVAANEEPSKKIPKIFIVRTYALSFSILAALLLLAAYLPGQKIFEKARNDYYHGNYMDAFLGMYGKELSESDQLIYDSARTIVLLQRKYQSFENNKAMQLEYNAIDALIQGVGKYEELLPEAERLGVVSQLNDTRGQIEQALAEEYQLTWDDAREILNYDALDYTNKLYSIVDGTPFHFKADEINEQYGLPPVSATSAGVEAENMQGMETMQDLLPEEEAYMNQEIPLSEATTDTTAESPEIPDTPQVSAEAEIGGTPVEVQIDSNKF